MTSGFGVSTRDGCVLQDITLTVELKRLEEPLFWNVGIACRMLLGIDVAQSAGSKVK